MTVKHRLALFLDLEFPPLLGILHFIQHVGMTSGTSQYVMSICKGLMILQLKDRNYYNDKVNIFENRGSHCLESCSRKSLPLMEWDFLASLLLLQLKTLLMRTKDSWECDGIWGSVVGRQNWQTKLPLSKVDIYLGI